MKTREIARLKRADARDFLDQTIGRKTRLPREGRELFIQGTGLFAVVSNQAGIFTISSVERSAK
jgi:hypothetical protein